MALFQSEITSLYDATLHMLETGEHHDVVFEVGTTPTTKAFKCHKLILAMRSDVFNVMFYGSLPEKETVKISDIEPHIFDIVLKYLYTDYLQLTSMQEAMKTFLAAMKYNISHLMYQCRNCVENNLDANNIIEVYEWANLLDDKQIKNKCKVTVRNNLSEIFKSKAFGNTSQTIVKYILLLENLALPCKSDRREPLVFENIKRWVEEECKRMNLELTPTNMRKLFDPLLPYIRFLSMTQEEFLLGPVNSGILELQEIALIMMNMAIPGFRELPDLFIKKRKEQEESLIMEKGGKILLLSHACDNRVTIESNAITSIFLIIGKSVELTGITLYVSCEINFPLELLIMKDSTILVSLFQDAEIKNDVLKIELSTPYRLLPGIHYTITVKWKDYCIICGCLIPDNFIKTRGETTFLISFEDSTNAYERRPHFFELMYNLL